MIVAGRNGNQKTPLDGYFANSRSLAKSGTTSAKYPGYSKQSARAQTFASWPLKEQACKLAEAGFFSTQLDDLVRCFQCGVGLRNWDPEDEPWVEHARWMPQCPFVVGNISMEFIERVQDAVRRDKSNAVNETNDRSAKEDDEKDCPPSNSKKDKSPGFEYPDSTYEKNPLLTNAAQSVLEFGYLPKTIKQAVDNIIGNIGGWKNLTGTLIMEEIFRLEDSGYLQPQKPITRNHLSTDEVKKENEFMKEAQICKICCEEMVSIVFLPCGHLVSCAQCSPALKKCPICRKPIKGSTKVTFAS